LKRKIEAKAFFTAVEAGLSAVEVFVQAHGVNAQLNDGHTLLTGATIMDRSDVVRFLIQSRADVGLTDETSYTPLHFAAQRQNVAIARELVQSGAPIDAKDGDGNTPLARAVFNSGGRREMIDFLLCNGADRDAENNYGVSPLKLANSISNYDVARPFNE
jgi:uncharacterized protein